MNTSEQLKRVVVKVGTTTLTYQNGLLNLQRVEHLCRILTDLRNQGKEVILVSSGAIAVGTDRLGLTERPRDIVGKQAASAVGQAVLMQVYENFFNMYNQKIAQILLTKDVFENEPRNTNARNTFFALLSLGVIPIVNENDTVSTDELGFSENDMLSAYVSCLTESDILIILSDIDGLFDSDPKLNPDAKMITRVDGISEDLKKLAGDSAGEYGTGGMSAKVSAAEMASDHGINTAIVSGSDLNIIYRVLNGEDAGTLFVARRHS